MNEVFADAHYLIAILNRRDKYHVKAVATSRAIAAPIVTTYWVLVECADALCDSSIRAATNRFIRSILTSPRFIVVQDGFSEGLDLFARRPDKSWSLTDCISFQVMETRGIREALTADHHFEQAGFVALLNVAS